MHVPLLANIEFVGARGMVSKAEKNKGPSFIKSIAGVRILSESDRNENVTGQ